LIVREEYTFHIVYNNPSLL